MHLQENISKSAHFEDLKKSEIDRLDDYCRPLQDDETLIRRMNAENRHLRAYPELKQAITDAVLGDDDKSLIETAEYIDMAHNIYNQERAKPAPPTAALLDHMNLCGEIFKNIVGPNNTQEAISRASDLVYLISIDMVLKIPEQELTGYSYTSKYLADRLETAEVLGRLEPHGVAGGYIGAIKGLDVFIDNRNHLENYLNDMPKDETSEIISDDQVEVDNKGIESIFKQAISSRCYGVKNGYKPQKNREGIFAFADLENFRSHLSNQNRLKMSDKYFGFENGLAYVMDSPETSYSKSIGTFLKSVSNPKSVMNSQKSTVNIRNELSIQKDGRLVSSFDFVSIEHLARDKGCYNTYRNIQAEILANFVDLVTPIENSNLANEIEKRDTSRPKKNENNGADIVRKLLIPRIKAAQIRGKSNENEYVLGEEDSSESRREVRLHGVVWHVRQLPEGWHASPNAQAMAADAGITLKSGETFVKPHERGAKKMGEIAIHLLVNRSE